jgi:hypothetical protein
MTGTVGLAGVWSISRATSGSRLIVLEALGGGGIQDVADCFAKAAVQHLEHDAIPVEHRVADGAGLDHQTEHVGRFWQRLGCEQLAEQPPRSIVGLQAFQPRSMTRAGKG